MENVSAETFVGLDVHRKSVVATAVDPLGHPVSQAKFGPTNRELVEYLRSLPGTKYVALEACSVWEHFYDAAASTGASVVLSNPLKTRLIAEANLKTDRVDSEALATLLRGNLLPRSYAPPPETRAVRSLVCERLFHRRKAASIILHTHSVLLKRGIDYEDRILVHRRKRESLRALHIEEVDRGLDNLTNLDATCKDLDRTDPRGVAQLGRRSAAHHHPRRGRAHRRGPGRLDHPHRTLFHRGEAGVVSGPLPYHTPVG